MRRRMISIAVVLALALVASACGARFKGHEEGAPTQGGGGGTSGSTTPATVDIGETGPGPAPGVTATEIKIGYLLPITGAAPIPVHFDKGVNAYWNDLNAKGGINGRKVKVIIEDTQSQASVGKDKAKKLIEQDKVFMVVVLDRIENQKALNEYLDQRKVPNIAVNAPANLSASQAWTFGIVIDQAVQGKVIADYFVKTLHSQKVAVLTENQPLLNPGRDAFVSEVKAAGGQVVYSKQINGQGTDFSSEARDLESSGAQTVWLYMAPTTAATFANQALQAGAHPTWFSNAIAWGFNLTLAVAPDAFKGAQTFSPWLPLSSPAAAPYKAAFEKQNPGEKPDDLGIVGWGLGEIVAEGLKTTKGQLGQNSFREAMQNLNFKPVLWAPINCQPNRRVCSDEVAVLKAESGQWNLVQGFSQQP
jgi:branched-chain amino acid transport system substrate-binding protein